jgi:two-component system response regulator AtoC
MKPILFIGNESESIPEFCQTMESQGFGVLVARTGKACLEFLGIQRPSLVVLNGLPPSTDRMNLLWEIKRRVPGTPVIMLSSSDAGSDEGSETPVSSEERSNDSLTHHISPHDLIQTSQRLLIQSTNASPIEPDDDALALGHSEAMNKLRTLVDQVADTDATVLIRGESGVGKGVVASLLHSKSFRREKPFVKINCAALPSELLEAELFGYEKGAFTGAHRRKPGKFELAHEGTIFLDEVGELTPPLQAKILHVLQDGEFSRLGGERDIHVDVRVLASTNRNLEDAVESGTFRNDLYYRLNVVSLQVPPLRDRHDEIPLLAELFLKKYSRQYHRPNAQLSPKSLAMFQKHHWPGNVRELENFVKRIVILRDEEFVAQEIKAPVEEAVTEWSEPTTGGLKEVARRAARKAERQAIQETLRQTQWNRTQAAKLLGISYKALLYKMQECGLSPSKVDSLENGEANFRS